MHRQSGMKSTFTTWPFSNVTRPKSESCCQSSLCRGFKDSEGNHAAACEYKADILNGLRAKVGSSWQGKDKKWYASATIATATLRYGFIFHMPKWTNVSQLAAPVRAEWDRYLRCLQTHENGHASLALPVFTKFQRNFGELQMVGAGSSKATAERAAEAALKAAAADVLGVLGYEVRGASNKYDERTTHGWAQGAKLNLTPINPCGKVGCAGHASSAHKCPGNPCGKMGCPGHSSATHRCPA